MLNRTNYRALAPGQWARVVVPDRECWKRTAGWHAPLAGREVDICVMPIYKPRYDSPTSFHWQYRVAYRSPGSFWPNYQLPQDDEDHGGGFISTYDFGLHESFKYHWDRAESDAEHQGKGRWLYRPASDDPDLCPGPDYSIYTCSKCEKVVTPFSNDDGDLVCPWCDVTGLVITDEAQLDRLEQVREFARQMGLSEQLERQLHFLGNRQCWGKDAQTILGYDFAPQSFAFAVYQLPGEGRERRMSIHGGLIYQGPGLPADGSFPSLTVSLSSGTGWFCHT